MDGVRRERQRAGYGKSGERWVERAEAKVFANRERYKNFLFTQPLRRAYDKLFTFSRNYQDALRIYINIKIHIKEGMVFELKYQTTG
jgi:hypothetical protein